MASNNIVTRLLIDDKDYAAKLDKAKKSNRDFANSASTGLTSALKGVAVGVAVAATAMESFKRVINASQTTSDAFEATMRGMRNSVDSFFTAISTGDFTVFSQGLDGIMNKAREAAAAVDALGNAMISYNWVNSENQWQFAQALTVMKDNDSNAADKQKAKATAEAVLGSQKDITEELRNKVEAAVSNLLTEGNLLSSNSVTMLDLDKVMRLDIKSTGEAEKAALAEQYREYKKLYDDIVKQNTVSRTWINPAGFPAGSGRVTDWDKVREAMVDINLQYQDAILYNEVLVRHSDEWLTDLQKMKMTSDNARHAYENMVQRLDKAARSTEKLARNMQTTAIAARSIAGINTNLAGLPGYTNPASGKVIPSLENGAGIGGFGVQVDVAGAQRSLGNSAVATGLQIIRDEQLENINAASSALSGMASVITTLSGAVDESTSSWMTWTAGVLQAISQALPQIAALTAASGAEAAAGGVAAVSKSASVAAVGGPVAAIGAAVSVAAAIVAAMSSIPKYEYGGKVPGTSYTGDNMLIRVNSGERVLTRDQDAALDNMLRGSGRKLVEFIIRGNNLYGVFDNYLKSRDRIIR